MPDTAAIETAEDLIRVVSDWNDDGTTELYVRLLRKAATEGYPVGVLESVVKAEALSDWEAAMCIPKDVPVSRITEMRETLCNVGPVVVKHGHRKGQATYKLNAKLL